MTRAANPRAAVADQAPAEPRRPVPPSPSEDEEPEHDDSLPADPDAPGRSLFDEDDDAVEPNEPA